MNNQEILDNAPEGATHVDNGGDYFKYSFRSRGKRLRSLADITELVELRKANAELEKELEEQTKESTTWLRRYDKSVAEQLAVIKERDKYKAHYDLAIEKEYPKKKFPRVYPTEEQGE